jgi:hypothetical protein
MWPLTCGVLGFSRAAAFCRRRMLSPYNSWWNAVRSVSIVSDYGLDDRAIGVRSPAGIKELFSSLCVQTGSGAHPASCTRSTWGSFPGGKAQPGHDANHWPPSSAEVVNESELFPLPPSATMACTRTTLLYFYFTVYTVTRYERYAHFRCSLSFCNVTSAN